ncbi:MAG TPA: CbiX/SirB N-terminal domain-containing protein [Nitrospirota bacterium]|nr:CbiX/SirB N-terminal domain-containing protein [Nitrospirota bacterium]
MKSAVIILGHGSRSAGADKAIQRIVVEVKKRGGHEIVEQAFLQHTLPALMETIESCARKNAERIVIVPYFMQPGAHVTRDIPALIEQARKKHPGIEILMTDFVGSHPLMAEIVMDLVQRDDCGVRR